jgi:hypothetical protein
MEAHLKAIESRADRRERELRAAVEDVKATSRIEMARLQAIHGQESAEKDEQLLRFQEDLERLVRSLRQWQAAATLHPDVDLKQTQILKPNNENVDNQNQQKYVSPSSNAYTY